jgi:hypothetical protein
MKQFIKAYPEPHTEIPAKAGIWYPAALQMATRSPLSRGFRCGWISIYLVHSEGSPRRQRETRDGEVRMIRLKCIAPYRIGF